MTDVTDISEIDNPAGTPIFVHSDVAECLQDILNAVKGEEVRGSIFDAIQLIDVRNVKVINEVNDSVGQIVDGRIINSNVVTISPMFTLRNDNYIDEYYELPSSGITNGTCNMSLSDMTNLIQNERGFYIRIKITGVDGYITAVGKGYIDESNPRIDAVTLLYNEDTSSYVAVLFSFYYSSDDLWGCEYMNKTLQMELESSDGIDISNNEISVKLRSTNPGLAFDNWGGLYATGGGGGGSYTNGDGIDITNNEISVKLRSTDPGLAFDSNGNLYATGGSGGSDFSVFIYHSSSQLYCNHYYSDIYNEVQSRQYPDFNVIIDYHPSRPFVKYYHGQITNCNSSAIRFRFDISTETTTHIVEYVLNSNDELTLDNEYIQENQKKLSSTNAGTGISITNDAQGNPVISLDLPQAEGGGF